MDTNQPSPPPIQDDLARLRHRVQMAEDSVNEAPDRLSRMRAQRALGKARREYFAARARKSGGDPELAAIVASDPTLREMFGEAVA